MKSYRSTFYILILQLFHFVTICSAQSPYSFRYQFALRDRNDFPLKNVRLNLRISFTCINQVYYSEQHSVQTDSIGLVSVLIGNGFVLKGGNLSSINWSIPMMIKVEVDNEQYGNYQVISHQILQTVPIAIYANTVDSLSMKGPKGLKGTKGYDITNIIKVNDSIQILLNTNDTFYLNGIFGETGNDGLGIRSVFFDNDTLNIILDDGKTYQIPNLKGAKGLKGDDAPKGGFNHHIGEYWGGGIIAHLYLDSAGNEHGIIVNVDAPVIYAVTGLTWSNVTTLIGPSAQSLTDGKSNTHAIINQPGHSVSVAYVCDTLTTNGYTDWYLPSINELQQIFNNLQTLYPKFKAIFSGSSVIRFLSSTEYPSNGFYIKVHNPNDFFPGAGISVPTSTVHNNGLTKTSIISNSSSMVIGLPVRFF